MVETDKSTGSSEVTSGESETSDDAPPQNLKGQVFSLLILITVFGLLYALVKFLPAAGDRLTDKISSVSGAETDESATKAEIEKVAVEVDSVEEAHPKTEEPPVVPPTLDVKPVSAPLVAADVAVVDPELPIQHDSIRKQITEALGGESRVEVRHIAYSTDKLRLITSLKLTPEGGEAQLIEIVFEQDDFGRYISAEDSPIDSEIKIWQ